MLVVEYARFLALPVTNRSNLTDITEAVCAVLIDLGCELVIVDEPRSRAVNYPPGHLKAARAGSVRVEDLTTA
jgi:hypothetical protein